MKTRNRDPRYHYSSGPEMPSQRLQLFARLRTLSGPAPTNTQPFTVMRRRNTASQLDPGQPRGIYRCIVDGMLAFYARTSSGFDTPPFKVDPPKTTESEVIAYLADFLDGWDPTPVSGERASPVSVSVEPPHRPVRHRSPRRSAFARWVGTRVVVLPLKPRA